MLKHLVLATFLLSTSAVAATPWLKKSQDSGYVMSQDAQSFACSIYTDHVEIIRYVGTSGLSTTEVRPVLLSGDIGKEIRLAAAETLTDTGTICDAPGTRITAHLEGESNQEGLLLFGQSTCYQDGERQGEHSTPLINLANALCGSL